LRSGIVLNENSTILKLLSLPVKLFIGGRLGSGKQYVPWIHLEDLCDILVKAIEDSSMRGVYNAVAPEPANNQQFTKTLGRVLRRPIYLPAPGFALKIVLGEMGKIILDGQKASAEKLEQDGFQFRHRELEPTLRQIFHKPFKQNS
jgi:hypothetical protein